MTADYGFLPKSVYIAPQLGVDNMQRKAKTIDSAVLTEFSVKLLDGAFETPPWHNFLDHLRQATKSDFAVLVFHPPGWPFEDRLQLISGDATPDDSRGISRRHHVVDNLVRREWTEEGRPYSLAEIMHFDRGANQSFYDELIQIQGITAIRDMRVQEASGVDAWLTIARKGADYGPEVGCLMSSIAPVLRGVLRFYVAHEEERYAARMTADAVGRLQFGWFALDQAGMIVDADAYGERVLGHSGVLSRSASGRLTVADNACEREIFQALATMVKGESSRPRAIPLRKDPWLDMLLVPARDRTLSMRAAPSAIAYVHGDNWRLTDRCAQLTDMFALSQNEARLTLEICRGKTIAEASAAIGLAVETGRSYSKAVYAKTGARGLPDLVRIVMGSVLALDPDG